MRFLALAALMTTVLLGGCRIEPNPPRRRVSPMGLGADLRLDLSRYRLVDLTHALEPDTTAGALARLGSATPDSAHPEAAQATRLAAPVAVSRRGSDPAAVPLEQLIGRGVIIDISKQVAQQPDYALSVDDVKSFEREHGDIREGDIVLLRTGLAGQWPHRPAASASDSAAPSHSPGYGEAAARLLVEERGVAALGVDAGTVDTGAAAEGPVRRLLAAADLPAFENLTNLAVLPPVGSLVIALPLKLRGTAVSPLRAIAIVADLGR